MNLDENDVALLRAHCDRAGRARVAEALRIHEVTLYRLLRGRASPSYAKRLAAAGKKRLLVITPAFEESQIRIRAMDFDQQSYDGRKNFYLPQFFKDNYPLVNFCTKHLHSETAHQYQREEQTLMLARAELVRLTYDGHSHSGVDAGGIAAAHNMLGEGRTYRPVPWFWSDQFDLKLQTAGLWTGADQTLLRGDPQSRSFAVFYLKEGRVIAVDAVNAAPEYIVGKKLVAAQARVAPGELVDKSISMKDIGARALG